MIEQILKQLWAQRKSNIWLFLELMLVGIFVWYIADNSIVTTYTYNKPTGFDASHIYRLNLNKLEPGMMGYVDEETPDIDNLSKLTDQIRLLEGIENLSLSYFSCFYSNGNSTWTIGPDTVTDSSNMEHVRVKRVSPEFFDLFRVKDENGERIDPALLTHSSVVLSKELKEKIYGHHNAIGNLVKRDINGSTSVVMAVTSSIRDTEYEKELPCFFEFLTGPNLIERINQFRAERVELLVRVNPQFDKNFMERFTQQMGERTKANNLYVSGIIPLSDMRANRLRDYWKQEKTGLSLLAFVLINVFFGIIATFWLRTGYRKGEIGLRMALGANRFNIFSYLYLESLCMLILTIIPVAIISLNIIYGGFIDTERLQFGFWRFVCGLLVTYLLLFIMIVLGVWYPAKQSAETEPATALHYE